MIIKIRNDKGLFSTGGSEGRVRFTKKGKTWSSLGYVKTHLRQHREKSLRDNYTDCTIVMIDDDNDYSVTELPFNDFLKDFLVETDAKNREDERKRLVSRKNYLIKEITKLEQELSQTEQQLSNF